MVVVCESCSTRFRIDDARIPAKGRQVRCSQCKATFLAVPGDASFDDVIDEVVAEVSDAGGNPLPEPAADLFAAAGGDLDDPSTRPEPAMEDEGWEFDDAPARPSRALAPPANQSAEASAAFSEPEAVGDPIEWDLLRDAPPAPRVARAETQPEPFLDPIAAAPVASMDAVRAERPSPGQLTRRVLSATAWLVLAGVATAITATLLPGGADLQSSPSPTQTIALADGEARSVAAGFLDNAFSGSLFVIRGELARSGADPRLGLRAYLLDDTGLRIGAGSWAGVAPETRALRERTPDALRSDLEASAAQAALGGAFVALFEAVPHTASSFDLALEPLPEPPASEPEALPEPEADGPGSEKPTASSPPASRPSSG